MKSFDEWWKTEGLNTFDYPKEAAESGFEAGQQSKQAEVDELQRKLDTEKSLRSMSEHLNNTKQSEVDELRKRIDATNCKIDFWLDNPNGTAAYVALGIKNILKGGQS